jgi:hypothetical protein
MIRKIAIIGVAALSLAACTQREVTGGVLGGAAGAAIGAAVGGDLEGAVIGGAIGAAAGTILGRVTERPGYCYARDQYGQTVVVQCPAGF